MEWICVKDRIPAKGERVLVFKASKGPHDPSSICVFNWYFGENSAITHWMPLPEPPEFEAIQWPDGRCPCT